MKTQTLVLKTKAGKVVATAYPWDSEANKEWQRKKQEKLTNEQLSWIKGDLVEIIHT